MSFIKAGTLDETNYGLFADIHKRFGFVPNLLRAQTARPDLLEAQSQFGQRLLFTEGALSRAQKEYIFLVCSAANLSTYCVTAHCEIIRMLKIEGPEPEQIAVDYTTTDLPLVLKALLKFATKLNNEPAKVRQSDVDALRTYGYTDDQILETVLLVGWAKFANFVSFGLGTVPDFEPIRLPAAGASG
jgi:uncharacterized peroxidase-related enzyme